MKVVWTLLAAFAVGSLAGCLLGSDRRPLHVNDPEAAASPRRAWARWRTAAGRSAG